MYILGISAFFHDSAAALICNGEVIAAVQEERFTRIKGDDSFPIHAVEYCLSLRSLTLADITAIVYYEKPWLTFERIIESHLSSAPGRLYYFLYSIPSWLSYKLNIRQLIKSQLKAKFNINRKTPFPIILFSSHHLSHAAIAYYSSSFEDATILCLDGVGESATVTLWKGEGHLITPIWEVNFPHSLGLLYSAFTSFCGFKVNSGEYKLMGLAPYGVPRFQELIESKLVLIENDGSFFINQQYFDPSLELSFIHQVFQNLFGFKPRTTEDFIEQCYCDLAASIQATTSKLMIKVAQSAREEGHSPNLCIGGGVAQNSVGVGEISRHKIFDSVYIPSAPGDAGAAVGAALAAYHMHYKKPRPRPTLNIGNGAFLGPEYSNNEIEAALIKHEIVFTKLSMEELYEKTVRALSEEKVIGWFQGRLEFGARALGNRSILADPRNPNMKSLINKKIKFREGFRPFAPSVLADQADSYFETSDASPFMSFVTKVKKTKLHPATTHIDETARIQTVSREDNPKFHTLISRFFELTGCPMLINTSFNIRGEPIVCNPTDGIKCFINTDLDALAIGEYWLTKIDNPQIIKNSGWPNAFKKD